MHKTSKPVGYRAAAALALLLAPCVESTATSMARVPEMAPQRVSLGVPVNVGAVRCLQGSGRVCSSGRQASPEPATAAPMMSTLKSLNPFGGAGTPSPSVLGAGPPPEPAFKPYGNIHRVSEAQYEYVPNGKPAMLQIHPEGSSPLDGFSKPFYVELTVRCAKNSACGDGKINAVIGLGAATESDADANWIVGLGRGTFGVHSDDLRAHSFAESRPYLPSWRAGDVIGIGLDIVREQIFFTRNGMHMGVAFDGDKVAVNLRWSQLLPTVSVAAGAASLSVNMGPNFAYRALSRDASRNQLARAIFARFDANGDNLLEYAETKSLVVHTMAPEDEPIRRSGDPFPMPGWLNFCRLTSADPKLGVDIDQFNSLYELGYGDAGEDWEVLTTRQVMPFKPSSPPLLNRAKTGAEDDGMVEAEVDIDGGWSEWSQCSHSCGWAGLQKRTCTEPAPFGKGRSCDGPSSRPCNRRKCHEVPTWSKWSKCSKTCGFGIQQRVCMSDTLDGCSGPSARVCKNVTPCSSALGRFESRNRPRKLPRGNRNTSSKKAPSPAPKVSEAVKPRTETRRKARKGIRINNRD